MKRKRKLGEEHVPAFLGTLGVSIIFNVRFPNKSGWVTKCIESGCIYQHHRMQFFPAASCQQTSPTVLVWIRVACELAKRCSSGDFEQHEAELHHGTLKLEFVPNIRRGIYPFRSHKRILYQIPGRNLSARFFWLWGVIRPLNSWTWGTSRRAEIQQQFRKSVVQETSLCTFVLRYLPTCSVIITYIFQTAYSYHFISVYISDCMCTTTHLYWPLHRSHTYHALESLAIGGCWSYISMDRVPRSPKDESESGGLKYFQCWLSHASTRTQMQKKKLLCSVAKQAIPGAKKNIATFVN